MTGTRINAAWPVLLLLVCGLPSMACSQDAITPQAKPEPIAPVSQVKQPTPDQRLCKETDLTGLFKLGDLKETPAGGETKWFHEYPYHYLFFIPAKHTYGYVASKHAFASSDDLQKTARSETVGLAHTIERKYTLDDAGLLTLYIDDRVDYSYRCLVLQKQVGAGKVGDLEFWGYTKDNAAITKIFSPYTFPVKP